MGKVLEGDGFGQGEASFKKFPLPKVFPPKVFPSKVLFLHRIAEGFREAADLGAELAAAVVGDARGAKLGQQPGKFKFVVINDLRVAGV